MMMMMMMMTYRMLQHAWSHGTRRCDHITPVMQQKYTDYQYDSE